LSTEPNNSHVYIADQESVETVTSALRGSDLIAIDTEADSFHHYFQKICLIQLTFDDKNYIVDPLAEIDLSGFLEVLSEKTLIIHDAGYDLRMMLLTFDFLPKGPVFDTMQAAQLLGYEKFSLSALTERFFDVHLKKGNQRADWSRRPLPESLLEYASTDTHYLHEIAEKMADQLKELGRTEWHKEACTRAVASATNSIPPVDPDTVWRIKGISKLPPVQLNMIRQLWHWRDKISQKADLPPFKIMGNNTIIELAQWAETHPKSSPVKRGPKLPRNCTGRRLASLEKTIEKAHEIPEKDWPGRRKSKRCRPQGPDCSHIIEALIKKCRQVAEGLSIKPSVIAPRATIETIARSRPHNMEKIIECTGMMKWQAKLLAPAVQKTMGDFSLEEQL
jgi:ribonuclease D